MGTARGSTTRGEGIRREGWEIDDIVPALTRRQGLAHDVTELAPDRLHRLAVDELVGHQARREELGLGQALIRVAAVAHRLASKELVGDGGVVALADLPARADRGHVGERVGERRHAERQVHTCEELAEAGGRPKVAVADRAHGDDSKVRARRGRQLVDEGRDERDEQEDDRRAEQGKRVPPRVGDSQVDVAHAQRCVVRVHIATQKCGAEQLAHAGEPRKGLEETLT